MVTPGFAAPAQLANGFYGITADETDRAKLPSPGKNTTIVTYDPKVSDPANKGSKRFLLVPTVPDVPMNLSGDPKKERSSRGNALLLLQLDPKHAKLLEDFTRKNAMKVHVAIIIGGEVVSTHKIRTPIIGGRIQITRCSDNACEVIYTKLKEAK